jgi:hypothetical protein
MNQQLVFSLFASFLIVVSLRAFGFPNSNEPYKYVKLKTKNLTRQNALKRILWKNAVKNGVQQIKPLLLHVKNVSFTENLKANPFLGIAKKLRMVIFYNKELKNHTLNHGIRNKKLKFDVPRGVLSIRNAKRYCSPITCIITVLLRG